MKSRHLADCLTRAGRINGLAIDHGRSLDAAIQDARGGQAQADDALQFKQAVVTVLGPAASLTLLDPEHGPTIRRNLAPQHSLVLGYEQDVYRRDAASLVPLMPPDWSVRRLAAVGARAIKLFLYHDPDAPGILDRQRKVVVERVGAECASAGLPFLLEPVTPSPDAKQRPRDILRAVQEFSQPHYQVDVLKIELPIRPRRVGLDYSLAQAQEVLQQIATTTQLPVVFLSGGVPFDELQEGLEFAADSAARFHGVLCGRSLWSGGIPVFAQQGAGGLKEWLACEALPNLQRLQRLVDTRASAVPIGLQPGLAPADATSAQNS